MEELIQFLLIAGVIVIAAYKDQIRKKKQAKRVEPDEEDMEPEMPEIWPPVPNSPTPHDRTTPQPEEEDSPLRPDPRDELREKLEALRREAARREAEARKRAQKPQPTPIKPPKPDNTGKKGAISPADEPGEANPLVEDFDAKKAIIWAEILKPKFEE